MPTATTRTALHHYIDELRRLGTPRLLNALLWMLTVGLLESIGLLLLLPLLGLLGLVHQAGARLTSLLHHGFALLDINPSLITILILYITLIGLRGLALRQRELILNRLQLGFVDHIRERLLTTLSHAEWTQLNRTRSADITHALTTDLPRIGQGVQATLQLLATAVLALAHLSVAFTLSIPLATLALLIGATLLLAGHSERRKTLLAGRALGDAQRQMHSLIHEFFSALKLAKSHGAETAYLMQWHQHLHHLREQQLNFISHRGYAQMLLQTGAALALALVIYIAVFSFATPPGRLLVIVIIFARLLPMIDTLHRHYQSHLHMLPAFITVHELETRYRAAAEMPGTPPWTPSTSTHTPETSSSSHTATPLTLHQGIALHDLRFRYDPRRPTPTLTIDTLWLPARRTTAIIGPSGAGKSTLADLLCGLLLPEQGRIWIDDQPLEGERRRAWRHQIAYVPQEIFLFHGTIRDNLLWANPVVNDAALWQALHQVAAADFVAHLPQGLDTRVGERGIHLSGGERQRIALARALLRQPLLLILDEATSALDTGNEERIRHALDSLHGTLTLVIIAHRLSTIRHADHIVILDAGRIIEQGDWATLIEKPNSRLRAMLTSTPLSPRQRGS